MKTQCFLWIVLATVVAVLAGVLWYDYGPPAKRRLAIATAQARVLTPDQAKWIAENYPTNGPVNDD